MAEIILYVDAGFGGFHIHAYDSVPDLRQVSIGGTNTGFTTGTWDKVVSSFVVKSGIWKFFNGANFAGQLGDPNGIGPNPDGTPRLVPWVEAPGIGVANDQVSSIQLAADAPVAPLDAGEIVLYVDAGFGGFHTHLFGSVEDLSQLPIDGSGTGFKVPNGYNIANWGRVVSSFAIVNGIWKFFDLASYNGQMGDVNGLGPNPDGSPLNAAS
jgi:hypothetical protein